VGTGSKTGQRKVGTMRAAIYCRISLDRAGEGLGVERQETLCRKLAAERGWQVVEVYIDNDQSAFSGKARPAYDRLMHDLEVGLIDAVICLDVDRLTRRPAELEVFIELAQDRARERIRRYGPLVVGRAVQGSDHGRGRSTGVGEEK